MSSISPFISKKIISKNHLHRLADWANGGNVYPITVEFMITDKCNNFCPMCSGGGDRKRSLANPETIINQLATLGIKGLTFTGVGEPLVDCRTPSMIKLARERGMEASLITNGLALTRISSEIIVKNCTWVRVSLDASNEADYLKTHGMPAESFKRVIENIRLLVKTRNTLNCKCTIGVGYLTNNEMLKGMYRATALCKELGVDYIQFRPFSNDLTPINRQFNRCRRLQDNNFAVYRTEHKYKTINKHRIIKSCKKCYSQQFVTSIAPDNKVYVCCHLRGIKKYQIGDLDAQSFDEIWHSEKRKKVVDSIDFIDCPPLCRADGLNELLSEILEEKQHVNFL